MGWILSALGDTARAGESMIDDRMKATEAEALAERTDIRKDDLAFKREAATMKLREEYAIEADNRKVAAGDTARTKMVSDIERGATGLINSRLPDNQVVDQESWTPEMEAVRNQGLQTMVSPRDRAIAAAKMGYTDEAAKLDKLAESGASNVPWGAARVDADGKVIFDNGTALKGDNEQKKADAATARGNGKTSKVDRYDEEKWHQLSKPDKAAITITDPMGGAGVESPDLHNAHRKLYNEARNDDNMSPYQAAEMAETAVLRIKQRAEDRLTDALTKDKKSTMTMMQAIRAETQEMEQYAKEAKRRQSPPSVTEDAPGADDKREQASMRAKSNESKELIRRNPTDQIDQTIPEPPPQTRNIGLSQSPNPAYVDWVKKYKAAWDKQRSDNRTTNANAADAAKKGYNPYRQNRVN